MASELRVNTLKDAAGANSVAVSTVASGSAKAWVNFNATGTPAARDSFNISSITDLETGRFTLNFSNSMDNADFAAVTSGGSHNVAGMFGYMYSPTTSSTNLEFINTSASLADPVFATSDVNGDLA